ncbi:MAG: hypothetical protein JWN63_2962 [Candidatus Acidoferrum typicum]|nr:hypothetical protein [Candidatus Acidoferrum typicum]
MPQLINANLNAAWRNPSEDLGQAAFWNLFGGIAEGVADAGDKAANSGQLAVLGFGGEKKGYFCFFGLRPAKAMAASSILAMRRSRDSGER